MLLVIDNLLINYIDTQATNQFEQKVLLILPGWQRSGQEWQRVMNQLSSQFRVLSVDFPGFANSPKPNLDWDIFQYSDFIRSFLAKLNIKKCSIIGHSFGGRIGIILASQDYSIEQLILVDAAGIEKKDIWLKTKVFLAKLLKPIIPSRVVGKLLRGDYAESGEMKEIFKKVINQDLTNLLPKIKTPTTVIWGENDRILPISHAKTLHSKIKNSRLRIVWGASHDPHLEKPELFIEILEESLTPVIPVVSR